MGRKRKIKLSDLRKRTLKCECGRSVTVYDNNVVAVKCTFCTNNVVPLKTQRDFDKQDKVELKREEKIKNKPPRLSKNGKRLGRPPKKDRNKADKALDAIETYFKKKAQRKQRDKDLVSSIDVVSNLVNNTPVEEEQEKTTKTVRKVKQQKKQKKKVKKKGNKKMKNKKTKGKRGRKPTVGAKIISFVNAQPGKVKFEEILQIYSEERDRLGKKDPDPKIEERNCRSTLYIMVRDGKLKEVDKKKTYESA